MSIRIIAVAFALCIAAYALFEIFRVRRLIATSKELVAAARPYQAAAAAGKLSILAIGDSTGYGVGAGNPALSIPGQLAQALDGASVENHAKSGAVTADLAGQLAQARQARYDVVLIQIGANDVVGFDPLAKSETNVDAILKQASRISGKTILMTAGRVGDAPLLPRSAAWLFTMRSNDLRSRFMRASDAGGALYVDLVGTAATFKSDPAKYYAPDFFHPSGAGYGVWFDALRAQANARWPGFLQ